MSLHPGDLPAPPSNGSMRPLGQFSTPIDTQTVGGPQKYHAKSLREIRRKYGEQSSNPELRGIIEAAGCLESLA